MSVSLETTLTQPTSFKFVTLRAPRKVESSALPVRYVQFSFTTSEIHAVESTLSSLTLYSILLALKGTGHEHNDCVTAANTFLAGTRAFDNAAELYTLFSHFDTIGEYLHSNQNIDNIATIKTNIESLLTVSIASYLSAGTFNQKHLQLWDNVLAQSITGANIALRELELNALRIIRLMVRINASDVELTNQSGIVQAVNATIILPATIFPLQAIINEPDEPVSNDPPDDSAYTAAVSTYDGLVDIHEDLLQRLKHQHLTNRRLFFSDPSHYSTSLKDFLVLDSTHFSALSSRTTTYLTSKGIPHDFANIKDCLDYVRSDLRALAPIVFKADKFDMAVTVGKTIIGLSFLCKGTEIELDPCRMISGASLPYGNGNIKPIGIADLKTVDTKLLMYKAGELAHIENILKSEKKDRTFRNFSRSETTTIVESETSSETEKESQTTDRFEVQKEASKIVQQDSQFQAGVSISAGYGPVSIQANASYAFSNSQQDTNKVATNYAKDVMNRAISRVMERSKTINSTTTILESEDTSLHGFDNTATGTDNISGVYRWVDKYYLNKVINYGKRLMFEFMVPEPAAFHIHGKAVKTTEGETMIIPEKPTVNSFEEINNGNFGVLATKYDAQDVTPPPAPLVKVSKAISQSHVDSVSYYDLSYEIEVPAGYKASSASLAIEFSNGGSPPRYINLAVGNGRFSTTTSLYTTLDFPSDIDKIVPFIVRAYADEFAISVVIDCVVTDELYNEWQIKTFNSLIAAYQRKKDEYDNWLNAQQNSIGILGNNPDINRKIEQEELKKHCIELFTGQRFGAFDAMRGNVGDSANPEFSFNEAIQEGKYIQFFEQAFEWEQMTYLFFPYFWGRKPHWNTIRQLEDTDPIFTKFLQAGAAKVLVPVRPGYDEAVLYYLSSGGQIWNGGDAPTVDDPLYVSIIDEIKEQDGQFVGGTEEPETWISKVPTNLIILDDLDTTPKLPDYSADLGL